MHSFDCLKHSKQLREQFSYSLSLSLLGYLPVPSFSQISLTPNLYPIRHFVHIYVSLIHISQFAGQFNVSTILPIHSSIAKI